MGYKKAMEYEIHMTEKFQKWLKSLRDRQAVKAIALRLTRAETGNFGDVKPVGGGVNEMRIFIGKGYRVYFTIRAKKIILLLCGGDKSSQSRDIETAQNMNAKG